ncbi:hypothetical protein BDZ89DRAFT_186547 [Hymenopellis radicata]|nr:hypothetical protein BDZ89DRAFT_186547 [Hymenopellis radicata]
MRTFRLFRFIVDKAKPRRDQIACHSAQTYLLLRITLSFLSDISRGARTGTRRLVGTSPATARSVRVWVPSVLYEEAVSTDMAEEDAVYTPVMDSNNTVYTNADANKVGDADVDNMPYADVVEDEVYVGMAEAHRKSDLVMGEDRNTANDAKMAENVDALSRDEGLALKMESRIMPDVIDIDSDEDQDIPAVSTVSEVIDILSDDEEQMPFMKVSVPEEVIDISSDED